MLKFSIRNGFSLDFTDGTSVESELANLELMTDAELDALSERNITGNSFIDSLLVL